MRIMPMLRVPLRVELLDYCAGADVEHCLILRVKVMSIELEIIASNGGISSSRADEASKNY